MDRKCIYCRNTKCESEFTLEHVIPQFLGGALAPDILKTRDVCKDCNSNLGLFVDAAFQKDWLVYNHLNTLAIAFFNPEKPVGLPLNCLGNSDLRPPEIKVDETCECWLGPLGEQIYWIRPIDESKYWYSGGNPRTVKKIKTRAYFLFSERSNKNIALSLLSFGDAFKGRPVTKILCAKAGNEDLLKFGFSIPDKLDMARIDYFSKSCSNQQTRKNNFSMYVNYDIRFLAKLSIGLSYTFLGQRNLNSVYMLELKKALWHKQGDPVPKIKGVGGLSNGDEFLKLNCGVDHGTTITILPVSKNVAINLNIGRKINWVIMCTELENLSEENIFKLGNGACFVFFKAINRCVCLSLQELMTHNSGNIHHSELTEIDAMVGKHNDYFKNL